MIKTLLLPALVVSVASFSTGALAQTYRASDVVRHFAPAPDLGPSRALCIGTDSECAKAVKPAKPAANFDLVVTFENNSATLTKSAQANLNEFAKALKDPLLDTSSFVVEGHTDGKGADNYNLDLSTRRANAVVEYLKAQGVPQSKLEARGYGKQKPVSSDILDPHNRRVETRLRSQ